MFHDTWRSLEQQTGMVWLSLTQSFTDLHCRSLVFLSQLKQHFQVDYFFLKPGFLQMIIFLTCLLIWVLLQYQGLLLQDSRIQVQIQCTAWGTAVVLMPPTLSAHCVRLPMTRREGSWNTVGPTAWSCLSTSCDKINRRFLPFCLNKRQRISEKSKPSFLLCFTPEVTLCPLFLASVRLQNAQA